MRATGACVWSGFAALVFAAVMAAVIVHLPPAEFWRDKQPAVEEIFGNTPRIICASIIAFWCGSFVNSYVLAKMKLLTAGAGCGRASSARRCAAS